MNRIAVAKELVKIAKSLISSHDKEWDEILELLKTKKHHGNEEMVDFFAQVWNGGIQQWLENDHYDELSAVVGVAKKMGPKGRTMAADLKDLDIEALSDYAENISRVEARDEQLMEELEGKMDSFDKWFYTNDDELVRELLAYLKQ